MHVTLRPSIDKFTKLIMLWFVIPLIVYILSPVYAIEITSTSKTVCVRPTDQLDIHCDCHLQTETDSICRTLDEWIRVNGSSEVSLFTSNTTVILLAGVHLINSTPLIEDVHSLVLTGDKSNTTVTCIQDFSITFVNSNHVSLSNITLNSCALRFLITNNTQLINLSIINGRLIIGEDLEDYYYYDTVDEKQCKYLNNFSINDSTFQNCPMSANGLSTLLYTFCVQINLSGVLFRNIIYNVAYNNYMNSIYIMNAYSMILTNVTIYKCSGSVRIFSVHKLVLQNMKIIRSTSNILLHLQGINTIVFGGDFIFKHNFGARGIVMRQVKMAWIASNSTLRIENNLCRLDLFIFKGDAELYPDSYINFFYNKSTLIFEDNHVLNGAVMCLDNIHLRVYNSKIIFRRNRSVQTDSIEGTIYPNAVLFLQNTECLFSLHSTLNFSHNINTAILSGGITLFNSNIQFMPTTVIYFEYNEGGDGGGMAFYKDHISDDNKLKVNGIMKLLIYISITIRHVEVVEQYLLKMQIILMF